MNSLLDTEAETSSQTMATNMPLASSPAWLDWNSCKPDGTESSMQGMLDTMAEHFRGSVVLSWQIPGGALHINSSSNQVAMNDAALNSALLEASCAGESCYYAATSGHSSLLLRRIRESQQAELVLGFQGQPLHSTGGVSSPRLGLVVFVNDRRALYSAGDYERLVHQVRRDLVDWIVVWNACHRTARFQAWIGYLNFLGARGSMRWLLLPLALLGMLAIPVPYWPQRDCTVEPAVRNFVASPIDGRVMQAHVRPGDVVQRGQLLAKLDDEQLQWALSSAHAELETANKKRDSALATRAAGDLRLAQLEQERLTIELDALERQLEQLELTSPVDGIIVQGDWYQSDGIPVNRGDTLFEIASLDTMRIETHLSSEDLSQIKVGDRATVRVDAAPGKSWPELLSRIDPRGQTLDSRVVFPADMDVANVDDLLRPGMKGSVRISAGSRSIGWLLFHRPYMWAMKKIFW